MINHYRLSFALAKAEDYKNCGNHDEASAWAAEVVALLQCDDILNPRGLELRRDFHTQQKGDPEQYRKKE